MILKMSFKFIVVLATVLGLVSADTYYVKPNASVRCPEKGVSCFTLSEYATKTSFTTNVDFVFLPGNHTLKTTLLIRDVSTLSIVALSSSHSDATLVTCTDSANFVFENISHVVMKGLKLRGCVSNKIISVEQFTFEDSNLQGANQIGGGLTFYTVKDIAISRSSFSGINRNSSPITEEQRRSLFGAMFIYNSEHVTISSCIFMNNSVFGNNGEGAAVTGLYSTITINESTFIDSINHEELRQKEPDYGGGSISVTNSNVTVYHSNFSENVVICNDFLECGGGAITGVLSTFTLHDCIFSDNTVMIEEYIGIDEKDQSGIIGGGAIHCLLCTITAKRCSFTRNSVIGHHYIGGGGAMYVNEDTVNIDGCTFVNNTLVGNNIVQGGALLFAIADSFVSLNDSSFKWNGITGNDIRGGAVYILGTKSDSSALVNRCNFTNNFVSGNEVRGGAMAIDEVGVIVISASFFNNNIVTGNNTGSSLDRELANVDAKDQPTKLFSFNDKVYYYQQSKGIDDGLNGVHSGFSSFFPNEHSVLVGGVAINIELSFATIDNCTFANNSAVLEDHYPPTVASGTLFTLSSFITINHSNFINNTQTGNLVQGGAMFFIETDAYVSTSVFTNNAVYSVDNSSDNVQGYGGAVFILSGTVFFTKCTFYNNSVAGINNHNMIGSGGAVYAHSLISAGFSLCVFTNNIVSTPFGQGGALAVEDSVYILINETSFMDNKLTGIYAGYGGAVLIFNGTVALNRSVFSQNSVLLKESSGLGEGGAVQHVGGELNVNNCTFFSNTVTGDGGALHLDDVQFNSSGFIVVQNNTAKKGSVVLSQSEAYFSGNITFSNNNGSLSTYSSVVEFHNDSEFISENNSNAHDGGAFSIIQGGVIFAGSIKISYNSGRQGGAIYATETRVLLYGEISISHNKASLSGGGIYAYKSDLYISNIGQMEISNNQAVHQGGGIHAIGSAVRFMGSKLFIVGNRAKKGGGVYLDLNAQVYVAKYYSELKLKNSSLYCSIETELIHNGQNVCGNDFINKTWLQLNFSDNTAEYGGAVYIADETYLGACYASLSEATSVNEQSECFLQTVGIMSPNKNLASLSRSNSAPVRELLEEKVDGLNTRNIYFINNTATVAGSIVYGGLLDRCTVDPFAEIVYKYSLHYTSQSTSAISYIQNITSISIEDFNSTEMISSKPVRVCFCNDNKPDCSFHPHPKYVNKGAQFEVSLVAVDQINNTIADTIIHASVSLPANLGKGQSVQKTNVNGICTELSFSIFSRNDSETLHLYAEGPCAGIGISEASLTVNIAPCPVGFVDTNTSCDCDPDIYPEYISNCFIDSESVLRRDSVWFTFENDSDFQGYIVHHHCPFDYCLSPSKRILVNLTDPNGADVMCAFNRSRKLCGSCKDGLSLSFGSSRCLKCSNNMLALLIVFAIAGIALVAFLLLCNFTVAIGTINSLIFYANVFAANRAIFFPFKPNFLTIFIAWLNLDFGFETCFYDGMDTYVKTWLQLTFPLYIITLVVLIIVISDYSPKFAALFKGKNPIATLATLILLSYTKLLRIIITSLSSATLVYSDSSQELVWLADGNVPYLRGKHIPLFILALVIVMVGVIFTALLFSWQWLVYCPNRGPMKWTIGNTKVIAFIDAYHNPFSKHHRYWIGLMLFVRVMLYLISTLNVLGDPRINLLSINSAIVVLLFYRHTAGYKHKIHKSWLTFMFESISLANLIGLASVTFYVTGNTDTQVLVVCISNGIAFITFLAMILYHTCFFVLKRPLREISTLLFRARGTANCTQVDPLTDNEEFESPTETEFDGVPPLPVSTVIENDSIEESGTEKQCIMPTSEDTSQTAYYDYSQASDNAETCNDIISMTMVNTSDSEPLIPDVETEFNSL